MFTPQSPSVARLSLFVFSPSVFITTNPHAHPSCRDTTNFTALPSQTQLAVLCRNHSWGDDIFETSVVLEV